jgi:hypothetical protein
MKHQRAVPPPRTDLRSRPERVAARVMIRGLDLSERLKARLLVEMPPPADDPYVSGPVDPDAFGPGDVLDARPVEIRGLRRLIDADAWQVRFRSTDGGGAAAVPGHASIPERTVPVTVGQGLSEPTTHMAKNWEPPP